MFHQTAMTFNAGGAPLEDDDLSLEDGEVPENYYMQRSQLASLVVDDDDFDHAKMTSMFFDLTQAYCQLLDTYPDLRSQIKDLIEVSARKEQQITHLNATAV